MRTYRSVPLISVAILLVAVVLTPLHATGAKAVYLGSIQIHSRVCPVGAVQFSKECSQGRGPIGTMIAVDTSPMKAMDGTGNVSFDDLVAGEHVVAVKTGPYAERFREMRALCSNSATGIYPSPEVTLPDDEPQFWVRIAPRSHLTCEVYFIQ